ncbi:G5 domain-containing protein [Actinomadura parmotrematis]|uniref:G5 domain-containing protein n=1 Tax=Actinomadura parmotrematis TaxID=2864039 RepID=A0ABS7FRW0_9ACTN|nr:G5 domain-containing protein [Actinomadura parmotrematis]MBW8483149.1 G5 domain-containing protein [Actinomadura parmotrematis]
MKERTHRFALITLSAVGLLALGACKADPAPLAAVSPASSPADSASVSASASATPEASTATKKVTETRPIPFTTRKVRDASLARGTTRVKRRGVKGIRTLTYEVTLTGGVQTARKLVGSKVTRRPVARIVAVGAKPASRCDPNYSGVCVPVASDVDCSGGSGDGPAYVRGPVHVIGSDIYDLDRDGDGVGCDT